MDENDTKPVVSPQRLAAAANVVVCLTNGRAVAHMAGEWAAGAIEQIEDPALQSLVRSAVIDWHAWETRIDELRRIAKRRLDALEKPPRVTYRPPGGAA